MSCINFLLSSGGHTMSDDSNGTCFWQSAATSNWNDAKDICRYNAMELLAISEESVQNSINQMIYGDSEHYYVFTTKVKY